MTDMWEELEEYQFYAEDLGFGDAWARMCVERTEESAWAATLAAAHAAYSRPSRTADAMRKYAEEAATRISKEISAEETK